MLVSLPPPRRASYGRDMATDIVPDSQHSGLIAALPHGVRDYAQLARFDRPIGWWLLLWPCWWSAALVAIAGPLTNLLIAFVVFGVGVLSGVITSAGVEATLAGQIVITAVSVNLGFFVFNILPIPPLDGSRVLYALAPDPVKAGMEYIERYGIFLVFGLVLIGASVLGQIMAGGINGILQLFMTIFRV